MIDALLYMVMSTGKFFIAISMFMVKFETMYLVERVYSCNYVTNYLVYQALLLLNVTQNEAWRRNITATYWCGTITNPAQAHNKSALSAWFYNESIPAWIIRA